MAKRIVWPELASQEFAETLKYWAKHNKSKTYSRKLSVQIKETLNLISEFPEIGYETRFPEVRAKTVNNFQIFYEERQQYCLVLLVWDTRRNPDDLEIYLT